MGSVFRKTTPSDNVMVPTTGDPFQSPRWAPPVWRMPEGIILTVNLIRAAVRVVVFIIQHPISSAAVAGLGWLGWRYDWPVPAVIVGLVLAGLGVWAALGWDSFLRYVARPVRARLRHVLVYRRHWQPVMVMSGLAFYRGGREYLPTLRKVCVTAATDRALVKMLSGQAPALWEEHAANLAHGFGASSCRVRNANRPGWIWLELVRKDALARPLPALPIPSLAADVNLARLPVGRLEDGTAWMLRLLGTHVLIAGATGAGKASLIWSTIRALLPAMRAGVVQVWGLDPKGWSWPTAGPCSTATATTLTAGWLSCWRRRWPRCRTGPPTSAG